MKEELTEIIFILDRSGSMGGLESDTIGGFNAMLAKQKKVPGEARVTTVLFDDQYELLHHRIPLEGICPLTDKEYYVRGCTALLDAIGKTIHQLVHTLKHTTEDYRPEKVIFIITTDGLENASKEYSYSKLKQMIKHQTEKYHWEFLFMGANIDAIAEASKLGIKEDRAVTYENNAEGVALNYEVIADTLEQVRVCKEPLRADWKKRIEK